MCLRGLYLRGLFLPRRLAQLLGLTRGQARFLAAHRARAFRRPIFLRKAARHRIAAPFQRRPQRILPAPRDNPDSALQVLRGLLELADGNLHHVAALGLALAYEPGLPGVYCDDPAINSTARRGVPALVPQCDRHMDRCAHHRVGDLPGAIRTGLRAGKRAEFERFHRLLVNHLRPTPSTTDFSISFKAVL